MQTSLRSQKDIENQIAYFFNYNEKPKRDLFRFEYEPKNKKIVRYVHKYDVLFGLSSALQS